jgi:hypothetical protein
MFREPRYALCKQEVAGSIPAGSMREAPANKPQTTDRGLKPLGGLRRSTWINLVREFTGNRIGRLRIDNPPRGTLAEPSSAVDLPVASAAGCAVGGILLRQPDAAEDRVFASDQTQPGVAHGGVDDPLQPDGSRIVASQQLRVAWCRVSADLDRYGACWQAASTQVKRIHPSVDDDQHPLATATRRCNRTLA